MAKNGVYLDLLIFYYIQVYLFVSIFLFFARNFSFLSSINGLRIYLDWC